MYNLVVFFFFQEEDGIRDPLVTGVQTCALPICRRAVLGSFLLESLVLALIGAVAGCTLAAAFSGVSFSTVNFSSFTEIKFRFHFAAAVGLCATVFSVAMGVLGGALPAIRAARLAIAEAIKG